MSPIEQTVATAPLTANPPLVSICIPVYNKAPFIEKTIRGALAQTHPNIQVVVTDNGSTDGSGDIIQRLAQQDPRISFHRFPKTADVNSSWRCVLELSTGEYCKYLGGDDDIHPEFVAKLLAPIANRPEIGFASCRTEPRFDIDLSPELQTAFRELQAEYRYVLMQLADMPDPLARFNFIFGWASIVNRFGDLNPVLFKRSCFPTGHWADQRSAHGGCWSYPDWDFLIRLHLHHRGIFVDEPLSTFVYNADSPVMRVAAGDLTGHLYCLVRDVHMPFTLLTDPELWHARSCMTPQHIHLLRDHMNKKFDELLEVVKQSDAIKNPSKWNVTPSNRL